MINRAVVGAGQRTELTQQHAADSAEVPLPLKHSGEFRKVRLEPILLTIALGRFAQIGNHRIDVVFQISHFAACLDLDGTREVTLGHRCCYLRDRSNLAGEVRSKQVDVSSQVPPGAGCAWDVCLSTETAFDADFTRDVRHLISKRREGIGHIVDGVGKGGDFALRLHGEALVKITIGHRGHHLDDPADLVGQVGGHEIDVVGEVLPGAGDAGHHGLAAELAFGAHLARYPADLAGKRIELVDHGVDGILQLEDLALDVHRDLAVEVAACHGGGDLRDVTDLCREVAAHGVDRVGQVLPCPGYARNDRLHAKPALCADLAGHAGDLGEEGAKLLDHRVDGFLELQDLATDVDSDFLREIAISDSDRHFGNVANLARQVVGHRVDVLGEVLPGASDAGHHCLAAKLALGADFARYAGHLRGKTVELIDHGIDGVLQRENLALHVNGDLAGEVSFRDGGRHLRDVADLAGQV